MVRSMFTWYDVHMVRSQATEHAAESANLPPSNEREDIAKFHRSTILQREARSAVSLNILSTNCTASRQGPIQVRVEGTQRL